MKKWKVILTALTLALSFSLTACSNKVSDDAFKLYQDSIKNMHNMKSAEMQMKMLIDANDMNMHMKVSADVKYNVENDLKLAADFDAAISGVKIDDFLHIYVKDQMLYLNILDSQKNAYALKELEKALNIKQTKVMNAGSKDQFKELSMEEKDGVYQVHAVFSDKMIEKVIKQAQDSNKDLKQDVKNISISKYEADMKITKDKQLASFIIRMSMKTTIEEQSIPMDIELTMDMKKQNQVKDISMPNFKDFQKASLQSDDLLNELEGAAGTAI